MSEQRQQRDLLAENHCEERKQCVNAKLDAIGELLLEMSTAHSKVKVLTEELEQIEKSEKHLTHHSLGIELVKLRENGHTFDDWNRKASRDLACIKGCISLRYNDKSTTCVKFAHDDDFCDNKGSTTSVNFTYNDVFLACDCLLHNTQVTDLTVPLPTSSDWNRFRDTTRSSFQGMLQHVRTSAALRRLHATEYGENYIDENTVALCNAIGSNPNIEEIHWHAYIPSTTQHHVLDEAQKNRLKLLSIDCEDLEEYTAQNRAHIPQSIANCTSLVKLRMGSNCADWVMIESILNHMADARTPLQELSIEEGHGYIDQLHLQSLARYLRSSTTLVHLELVYFHFDSANVESILVGLTYHYSLATASISKISLEKCKFDNQASDKFGHFLRETRYNESSHFAVLKELEISIYYGQDQIVRAIASSLAYHPPIHSSQNQWSYGRMETYNHSIGLGIRRLKLHNFLYMKQFCAILQSNAKYIHLCCLHISAIGHSECMQLASCIPNLLSLQELCLDKVDHTLSNQLLLLSMIQRFGNLRMVSIRNDKGHDFLNDPQSRLANAFCERNQALHSIFANPIRFDRRYENNPRRPKRLKYSAMHHYDTALLLPTLLQVAKQVPINRVSTIVKALLTLVVEGIEYV